MLTVNELFSGIGSQSAALERLGIDFKVVGIAEIDKYAIKSYEAINGSVKNYGDISKIEKLDYADFWTYSFPCQDISVAGKQRGINENTRSGLLYEVERLLYKSIMYGEQPKYLMLENVKNLVGKQFKPQFDEWLKRLDELGYNTYWKVLNAKNYGIPQNRERVFAISIRKDIDTGYEFPVGFDNGKRLKDILESEVDEKYYLNGNKAMLLIKKLKDDGQLNNSIETVDGGINKPKAKDISNCIKARYDCGISNQRSDGTMVVENKLEFIGGLKEGKKWLNDGKDNSRNFSQGSRVYDSSGLATTLTAQGVGGKGGHSGLYKVPEPKIIQKQGDRGTNKYSVSENSYTIPANPMSDRGQLLVEPTVKIKQATKQGYIECNVPGVADLSFPDSKTRRGRVQENGEICPTLTAGTQDLCYIELPCIGASRGRNPENPSDRTVGSPTEQRLEFNKNGTSNTITTVQKDNYVIEPNVLTPKRTEYGKAIRKDYERGLIKESRHNMTEMQPRKDGICNTLTTVLKDNYIMEPQFRIRKLTPLECWRLMGFTDEQFYKAEKVNSNRQLYKQAGNSIVVDVLYYLFKNLFDKN